MKFLIGTLLFTIVAAPAAHAGLFDLWKPLPLSSFHYDPEVESSYQFKKAQILEVRVAAGCSPQFVNGDDGIFRRAPYCHRANPNEPRGFMAMGYDVPGEFLKGFTEADVVASWRRTQRDASESVGSLIEVPRTLFIALNVKAARAWEMMLVCAGQNPDLARELYRANQFECQESEQIRSLVAEVRASLLTLSASVEGKRFLEPNGVSAMIKELQERKGALPASAVSREGEQLREDLESREYELRLLRLQRPRGKGVGLRDLLFQNHQKLPRLHPLFSQILLEELVYLMSPEEEASSAARRLGAKGGAKGFFLQLLLWIRSVEDLECSSFGLWPSANRVAVEALGDKAIEIWRHWGGPGEQSVRGFDQVVCPPAPGTRVELRKINGEVYDMGGFDPNHRSRRIMRLNDVYTQGRAQAWREVRELRDRFVRPAKSK